jgi:hypothetical protein
MRPDLQLKAVIRYVPTIATILNRWPDVSEFKPTDLSAVTFAARLRDAIRAATEYHQAELHDQLNIPKLLAIYHDIIVSHRDGDTVLVGPADSVRNWKKGSEVLGVDVLNPHSKHVVIERLPDDGDFLLACAVMCTHRIDTFANGVLFRHLTDEQINELENLQNVRDVNVIRNDDGSYVML